MALDKSTFEGSIFLENEGYDNWAPFVVTKEGFHNRQLIDFEGDGDPDIFRYPTHDTTELFYYKSIEINN